jgi:hypothetical protein
MTPDLPWMEDLLMEIPIVAHNAVSELKALIPFNYKNAEKYLRTILNKYDDADRGEFRFWLMQELCLDEHDNCFLGYAQLSQSETLK